MQEARAAAVCHMHVISTCMLPYQVENVPNKQTSSDGGEGVKEHILICSSSQPQLQHGINVHQTCCRLSY